jgi:hypothetical protein
MNNKQLETRRSQRQARREERRREEERLRSAKKRRTIWISAIVGVTVVIVIVIIANTFLAGTIFRYLASNMSALANNNTSSVSTSALASDNPAYPVVDDIACQTNEQLAYHVHAHLSIYVNGQSVSLPANIGIASDRSCIYWLHTHRTDGVIHVESPNANKYSLRTFFKMWEDYFSSLGYPLQLNSTDGWQVYVNGKPFSGDFHNIQLEAHQLITLAYNSPNVTPDVTYSWGSL